MTALTLSLPALFTIFIAALNFKWDHTEASEVQNVILSVMLILMYAFTVLVLIWVCEMLYYRCTHLHYLYLFLFFFVSSWLFVMLILMYAFIVLVLLWSSSGFWCWWCTAPQAHTFLRVTVLYVSYYYYSNIIATYLFFNSTLCLLSSSPTPATTTTSHLSSTITLPTCPCTGFIHFLSIFFWVITVTTSDIGWMKLRIPLLSKHVFFVAFNSIAKNISIIKWITSSVVKCYATIMVQRSDTHTEKSAFLGRLNQCLELQNTT